MKDLVESMMKWVRERTTSPLYGTFIASVVIWNWKFFYVLFWQSEDKLNLPRIEYVQNHFLYIENFWIHIIYFLVLPAISTYLIIWWLPLLSNKAHKKHSSYYYERLAAENDARLKFERRTTDELISISELKKAQSAVNKEIENNTTPEQQWDFEFQQLSENELFFRALGNIEKVIYGNGGNIVDNYGNRLIESSELALLDAVSAIDIEAGRGIADKGVVKINQKGKRFINLLQNKIKF